MLLVSSKKERRFEWRACRRSKRQKQLPSRSGYQNHLGSQWL